MAWWMAIPAVAGAVMGAQRADRQANQQRAHNLAQAEVTRYSPWTGMKGQMDSSYAPSQMEGGFGGAVQGLGMAQSLQGAFGGGSAKPDPTAGMDAQQKDIYGGIARQQAKPSYTLYGNNPFGRS